MRYGLRQRVGLTPGKRVMNEKLKLGASLLLAVVTVAGAWAWLKLPSPLAGFATRHQFWFGLLAFALTALIATFELSRRNAVRLAGVTLLLAALVGTLGTSGGNPFDLSNVYEVLSRHGSLGVIGLGAALLIITGGIDLSIGSVVGLAAMAFGVLMEKGVPPQSAAALVLLGGAAVGLTNGLLVTLLRLQSFLVTLCGMFVFRGLAREMSKQNTGLVAAREAHPEYRESLEGMREWLVGKAPNGELEFPALCALMLALVGVAAVFLHKSAYGRYWFAIGYNERAAEYAGVRVGVQRVGVFVICSTLAALGGVLSLLFNGSADPATAGQSLELYAITAAVLGGVSLRGGEGTAVGLVLGALVQPVINNLLTFRDIPSESEPWVMGLILLLGTIADELIRRRSKVNR
jgi:ribose transport system permease protein